MEISPLQTTSTLPTVPAESAASGSSGTSDFDTYLLMLTAQLKNQDPLNPMDSNSFAVDLATFSGVEAQVLTNELLQDLTNSLAGSGVSEYSDWIGKEVRAAAPGYFDGATPISVEVPSTEGASASELVVRDPAGFVVDRQSVSTTGGPLSWSGISSQGSPFLAGLYHVRG